jgi:hypothetical protein
MPPEVFLSYARADGETLAADLRQRLAREAPDIVVKYDRLFLGGGRDWWKQVAEAIEGVHFLVLLMTPAALASGNVQKEWRHARQQGVCVYPAKKTQNPPDFAKMPRWMSRAHFWPLLLAACALYKARKTVAAGQSAMTQTASVQVFCAIERQIPCMDGRRFGELVVSFAHD